MKQPFRIGYGFDVHALTADRKMIIGGIEIPHTKGFLGHSDADILLHAICDALLGALALGDIGTYFPDNSEDWKDYDSSLFVKKIYSLVKDNGYQIGNIDSMIALQKPKILPFINQMKKKIADLLDCDENQVSIKASTTEKLGFIGREEGAAAFATILLIKS